MLRNKEKEIKINNNLRRGNNMIITKIDSNVKFLFLDKNENVTENKEFIYNVELQNQEECDTINIKSIIVEALSYGIKVYPQLTSTPKLEYVGNKTIRHDVTVVTFSTRNKDKLGVLEDIIKKIMIKGKKYLN